MPFVTAQFPPHPLGGLAQLSKEHAVQVEEDRANERTHYSVDARASCVLAHQVGDQVDEPVASTAPSARASSRARASAAWGLDDGLRRRAAELLGECHEGRG